MPTTTPTSARPRTSLHAARLRAAAAAVVLALAVPAGWTAIALTPTGAAVSTFWPNSGLGAVALLLAPRRLRGPALVGVLAVTAAANLLGGREPLLSLWLSTGTTVAAGLTAWWLTRGDHGARLHTLGDLARLLTAVLLGAGTAAAVAGVAVWGTTGTDLMVAARAVLTAHAASLLVLVPLAMRLPARSSSEAGPAERAASWGFLLLTIGVTFAPRQDLPLAFLAFPILVWGAARLPLREVLCQLLVLTATTAVLTGVEWGPFAAALDDGDHAPEVTGTLLTAQVVCAVLVVLPLALVRTRWTSATEELSRSHELLSSILASTTGNAILGATTTGRIEFFNVGAERLLGWSAEEVVGSAALAVDGWDGHRPRLRVASGEEPDAEALHVLVEPLLDSPRTTISADWTFARRDGTERIVAVALSRRYGDAGEPVGYLGVAEDVTERRRQEDAVRAALEKEKQIVERLAQVDQAKNDFLATVSHELRTPITSVLGYSELLLSDDAGTLPAMHRQIVGRIERNGRRLLGLIEDMLTMSQVEVGSVQFDRRRLDLRGSVHRAAETLRPSLGAKRLELEQCLGPEPVEVCGDADKLERVFTNLLDNAVKFSHEGDTIVARLAAEDGHAVFTVSDTGLGIRLEDQPHLFDRFYRGSDAHELAIQGVGLGLSVASSIVTAHDGRIDVVSEPGCGSTFVVRLPLLAAQDG